MEHAANPAVFPAVFRWSVRVYYEDTDAAGIVYYANYLRYFERCRTEWLVPFLTEDPAPEIRQCAALGLAGKADESATQPLVQALSDADGMVGSLAATALVRIGSAAVPSLIETVHAGMPSARIMALRALAEIRDHRAIPIMMKVMGEDSALLQHWAKEGLDRLGLDMIYLKPD